MLECARFYLQIAIYPLEIEFKNKPKPMMGYWITQIEETISFDNKKEFLEGVKAFNKLRNSLFHGITKKSSTEEIMKSLDPMSDIYHNTFDIFQECYDDFRLSFKDRRKEADDMFFDDEE